MTRPRIIGPFLSHLFQRTSIEFVDRQSFISSEALDIITVMKYVLYCVFFLLLWITPNTRICASYQGIPLSVVKLWASAFGGEIKSIAAKYSGSQLLQKKYKEFEQSVRVEEIDGIKLVKKLAGKMEQMFHKKAEAIKRLVEAAEEAHLNHEEDPELQ
ncbi:hypothetical protein QQF64_031445, partial [Cirrhinus molitorella]